MKNVDLNRVCGKIKSYLNVKQNYLYIATTGYEKLRLSMYCERKCITDLFMLD